MSRLTEGTVPGGAARNRALAALCLTEIVSYGVLFRNVRIEEELTLDVLLQDLNG